MYGHCPFGVSHDTWQMTHDTRLVKITHYISLKIWKITPDMWHTTHDTTLETWQKSDTTHNKIDMTKIDMKHYTSNMTNAHDLWRMTYDTWHTTHDTLEKTI